MIGRLFFSSLAVWFSYNPTSVAGAQPAVRPQDDFYSLVNGVWLRETDIPNDVPWISPFVTNTLAVQGEVRSVIEETSRGEHPHGSARQLVRDFYRSYLSGTSRPADGLPALAPSFAAIDALEPGRSLASLIGTLFVQHKDRGVDVLLPEITPLTFNAWSDRRDSSRSVLVIRPSGLGLPDPVYYTGDDGDLSDDYTTHIALTLRLAGQHDADEQANRVVAFEAALAGARLPPEDLHDASATWHPTSVAELKKNYPAFEWGELFARLGLEDVDSVVLTEPDYLDQFNQLVSDTPAATWKAYLRWQLLRRYAEYLGPQFSEAAFSFYGRRLMGNETPRPLSERAGLATEGAFPFLAGRLWSEKYVAPETVPSAERLAEDIRDAFAERIEGAQWLEPATKRSALEKLDGLLIKIGYPETWPAAPAIDIEPDDLVGNLTRVSAYRWQEERARLAHPVDRSRWLDVPQSTNAYYNRTTNELAIPAGNLRPPYFDPEALIAANLGGIGTIIGHEMGHAFDDQGAQYDATGRLRPWWADGDQKAFESKVDALTRQYNRYEALPGRFVDGPMTVSENIGDLTGVTVAYAALVRLLENEPPAAQARSQKMFFEAFCRRLRAKYREPLLIRVLEADSHPPQKFRCLGPLSNFEPFYEAYGVEEGDGMYRAPEARVSIW